MPPVTWRRRDLARPQARRSRLATLVALAVGLAATSAAAAGDVVPIGKGARKYFAPPSSEGAVDMLADPLGRGLCDLVARAAAAQGQTAPRPDARLGAVAETLADSLGPDEVPGLPLQEFLLSHFGLGDPLPELSMFQVGMDDDTIRSKFAARIPGMMRGGPFGHVGVGVVRHFFGKTSVVLALQREDIELLPVPRKLAAGDSAFIAGRLLRGRRDPRVLVAPPRGEVQTLAVRGSGDSFQTSFRCDAGVGRYQLEIVGTGSDGKSVVANFPIFCGVDPPASAPRSIVEGPETTDRKRAEVLATQAVNQDRAAVGLAALVWDEALARAARGYSDELARRQVVEHTSRESGDAADRVRRAGARALVVYENVGRANSIADAERSFMSSPGHRANILARPATRIGVGVTFRQESGSVPTLYVTQLFAR
jgi:uncharacterized protein YkwD